MAGIQATSAARALARKLAVQALYRWQLNAASWQDLVSEFADDPDMRRADRGYFADLIRDICIGHEALDESLRPFLDRAAAHLDPIEHAVLWIASCELQHRPEIPFRVVINEAVGLTRRYGGTDGHKFVNGVLDRAAHTWRAAER
jgi:transcription antitermination protein NusB